MAMCPFLKKECIRSDCEAWMAEDRTHYGCIIINSARIVYDSLEKDGLIKTELK